MMSSEEKCRKNMRCLDKWLSNREKDKRIADYLKKYEIHRIGVYGYGILGKHLVMELRGQDFPISWVMDKSSSGDELCCSLARPNDVGKLEDVDMAIITTLADVEEVETLLLSFVTGKIISVDELVESIYMWGNQN